ncbi:general substrate transporter [Myriangium duriaei CBS 260.36]|uniref:General substrate transporter n=1 Tax=Myriangium duriaei CBS 260.36 TaxID=1168546 RepID=A0A9P4IXW7_9PEZI|nr:general substrate transporter [Myriangium duriaei CBS 260.36]
MFLQRVVHNEAIKNDPPEIYGWRVYFLACSACWGGTLFGMDIGIIGGVLTLDPFKRKYGIDKLSPTAAANLNANIVSTLQAGAFLGALIASWTADHFGRRLGLMLAAAIVLIGCIFQAAADGHLAVMYIGRFVAGVGVGSASMITPLYCSENAPRAIRGAVTGLYQLFITMGTMLAFWTNYGALLHLHGTAQYVVPLCVQAIPAILILVCMPGCSESTRWLAKRDRWEDANATLSRLRQLPQEHPYVQFELAEMKEQLDHERMLIGGSGFWDLQREMWTIPGNRHRALISVALMICQQMTGTNAINYYAPLIFGNLGLNSEESGLFATGIYGVVKMTTCAGFLLFCADSLGRRRSLLWTSIAQGLAMFYVGLYVRIDPPVKGAAIPPAGYFALVCIYLFASFYQFGWGPCPWILVSEIPSARLRSLNVSMAAATQWLFNFVVARATPNMLTSAGRGGYGAFLIYGSFCFSMFIFTWFFIKETKGLSLERMDDIFGVTELAKDVEQKAEANQHPDQQLELERSNIAQAYVSLFLFSQTT